ncbi:MAG: [FeFe] hydrogenase H-cluster maturation GTPase HydF [Epulopiscium sp.]|nr:[FeFe] hydrogenase H-cluster maturation GTPase HydF [Candidatus Epulonipiscium sp.]
MQKTPMALRKHVSIFGKVNAGKSSLFNAIIGQKAAIVSEKPGTTTDPVTKAMELVPFGPIVLVDTAGFGDLSEVGKERMEKTQGILNRTDIALYVIDSNSFDPIQYKDTIVLFKERSIPYIVVFTKMDLLSKAQKNWLQETYPDAVFTDHRNDAGISQIKEKIGQELEKIKGEEDSLIGNVVAQNSLVILVVPIDSGAPKGRLILPQVQLIRDCLDHGIRCLVTREDELSQTLKEIEKVDLVVTDSQLFKLVSEVVPEAIPLTSFSMLLARQKGDIHQFIDGAKMVDQLKDHDRILMAEGCTHNATHEDIGKVKIPTVMKKYTGKQLHFDFYTGYDFPHNIDEYQMVVHCGGCMLNKKAVIHRLSICQDKNIPMTNYGVLLAYLNGILPRCSDIFTKR